MTVTKKLKKWLHKSVLTVCSIYIQGKSIAQDPVKTWELGLNVILRVTSLCCILPLTVSIPEQDGIRTLSVPRTTCPRVMTYVTNVTIVLRLVYYISISFDDHFKWMTKGQFTPDSTLFVLILLVASMAYAIHCSLLYYEDDFALLRNSVLKLNRTFSGSLFGA